MSDQLINGVSIADRLEVLDLFARQSHAVDASDGEAWANTFTPDGAFVSATYNLTARGFDELVAFTRSSNEAAHARGEQFRHHIGEVVLDAVGPNELSSTAYLFITATSAEGTRIDRSLVIKDRLVRHEGRWLVAERITHRD